MPQFVILRHTMPADAARPSHFDLMLEHAGMVLTWAISEMPSADFQSADELSPHRIDYLTYEGQISNNRGEVQRVISGTFEWLLHNPNLIRALLHSSSLSGQLQLQRTSGQRWACNFISRAMENTGGRLQ